jgi:hypothetical protein
LVRQFHDHALHRRFLDLHGFDKLELRPAAIEILSLAIQPGNVRDYEMMLSVPATGKVK